MFSVCYAKPSAFPPAGLTLCTESVRFSLEIKEPDLVAIAVSEMLEMPPPLASAGQASQAIIAHLTESGCLRALCHLAIWCPSEGRDAVCGVTQDPHLLTQVGTGLHFSCLMFAFAT